MSKAQAVEQRIVNDLPSHLRGDPALPTCLLLLRRAPCFHFQVTSCEKELENKYVSTSTEKTNVTDVSRRAANSCLFRGVTPAAGKSLPTKGARQGARRLKMKPCTCWECQAANEAGYKAAPGSSYCKERSVSV